MKKLVALVVGLLILGFSATSVSADEYEVQHGDTLWNIAKDNNTTVETIKDINGLSSSLIYPKQKLVLEVEEDKTEYYIVQKGDTLSEISREHSNELTPAELIEWNNLSSDLIYVGQQLVMDGEEITNRNINQTSNNEASVAKTESEKTEVSHIEENEESKEQQPKEEEKQEVVEESEVKEASREETEPQGKTLSVEATAYTAYCNGCSGITATGVNLKEDPNAKVIAVDPNVIPLGSTVYVEGYGQAVAADTGGAINGNKIDIHVPTKDEAYQWGRRTVEVTIVD